MNSNKDIFFILELHGKNMLQSPKRLEFMAFLYKVSQSNRQKFSCPLLKEGHFFYKRACFNSSLMILDLNLSFQHLGEGSEQRHSLASWYFV